MHGPALPAIQPRPSTPFWSRSTRPRTRTTTNRHTDRRSVGRSVSQSARTKAYAKNSFLLSSLFSSSPTPSLSLILFHSHSRACISSPPLFVAFIHFTLLCSFIQSSILFVTPFACPYPVASTPSHSATTSNQSILKDNNPSTPPP